MMQRLSEDTITKGPNPVATPTPISKHKTQIYKWEDN